MSNNQKFYFQTNEISQKKENIYIKDYKIIKRVGFGSSGLVYKVTKKNDPTNKLYILKQIPYSEPNLEETTKKVQNARNEALILSRLSCKFIVKYFDSFVDSDNNLNIIMEYCDSGDLNSLICNLKKENKYLSEDEIWNFFIQISLGLAYIHSKNILHRDLKPMNIFLTNKNQIKIGDLGVAKLLNTNANASTCIGTPYYLSPEICKEKPYNSKGDVWALGCILYELCTFNKPFSASNPAALILKIINGNYTPLKELKNGINYSKEIQYMIDSTLQKDYLIRPLMKDIINSSIFKDKAISLGFKEDLESIKNLYEHNLFNDEKENKYEKFLNNNSGEKNNNINIYPNDKENNLLNNNKNFFINKNENNTNNQPIIHSIKTKTNYLSSPNTTNDSSHNYEKGNNIIFNEINNSKNIFNNHNEVFYSQKNSLKNGIITKPRTKYIKYITKKNEKENSSDKKQRHDNYFNKHFTYKDTNYLELKSSKPKSKLKMFQISMSHFRDHSGGRYNRKNNSIINLLNFYGSLSSKNKINNSKEKKYIDKTKNILYSSNLHNINNNKYSRKVKIANSSQIQNPFLNKNIKSINIRNMKNMNRINEKNTEQNNNQNIFVKNNRNDLKPCQNITDNSKEKVNNKIKNYINYYDKNNLNYINNFNINYSLNFIEKTRSNFFNKNFSNIQEPIDVMKMHTQNNFNNLNNFRIENGFENIYSFENSKNNETSNINNININLNKSQDSLEEHGIKDNYLEEEIIEDSGMEDEDDEEKVSIVKERNILEKENLNKEKEENIHKYNEYKNQILQYKNIIDVHKLFSLYEKISKNKTKFDDNMKEIEDYMKNNLRKDLFPKFRKLFKNYIYYDIKLQNSNRLQ